MIYGLLANFHTLWVRYKSQGPGPHEKTKARQLLRWPTVV